MRGVLSQDELRRRIRAARVLADVSQVDMNRGGQERGLPKNTLGKVERGDLEVRHVHLAMLCEILGVPMSWFTEPREVIVARRPADYAAMLDELDVLLRRTGGLTETASGEAPRSTIEDGDVQPDRHAAGAFADSGKSPRRRAARRRGR